LLAPVVTLLDELTHGAPSEMCWVLNGGDPGLLASLDRLTARQACASPANGGPTVAAHVNHLRYGLELLNRWEDGEENPFASADWAASWDRTFVDDGEWDLLRSELRQRVERWRASLASPRDTSGFALTGIVAAVVHIGYHMGALRQIDRTLTGPEATPRAGA
jgi:hypothetical protein